MKLKPLKDRVVIAPEKKNERTESGLYLPDSSQEKPLKGTVLATGEACATVVVDNVVLYGKYAGTEVPWESDTVLIMKEEDILAIII